MTDKERLEEINELLDEYYKNLDDPFASTDNAMAIVDKVGYFVKRVQELEEENKRYQDMLVKIFKIVQNHQIMKISDEDYADAATFLYKWIYDTGAIDHEKHFSEVYGHDEFDSHQINLLFKEHMSQKSSKALEGEE